MLHHQFILVKPSKRGGLGCFAKRELENYLIIEQAHVILFPCDALRHNEFGPVLREYGFAFNQTHIAIALGMGSIFNHSQKANVDYYCNETDKCIYFLTKYAILEGEELTINYGKQYVYNSEEYLRDRLLSS